MSKSSMTEPDPLDDEQQAVVSEFQRLRRVLYRWRAIAFAALVLVFLGLIPFTVVFWRLVEIRRAYTAAATEEIRHLHQKNKELEKQLLQKTNAGSKGLRTTQGGDVSFEK